MQNLLLEVAAIDPQTGLTTTIRMASSHADASGTYLNNYEWMPAIVGGPVFTFSDFSDGIPQPMDVTYGQLSFNVNRAFNNLDWTRYSWQGSLFTLWIGKLGDPFANYTMLRSGSLGPIERDTDQSARVSLLGPEASLNVNLLSATYAGSGGREGPSNMLGKLKPWQMGLCTNVEPVLIDPVYWIYQVDAYDACAVNAVYENALTLNAPAFTKSSYDELKALTMTDGTWAAAPSVGMFRLANEPAGKITADVGSAATTGAIVSALMSRAGLSAAKIDSSVAAVTRNQGIYVTEQTLIIETIRQAALQAERYLIADAAGKFYLAPHASTKAAGALTSDRSTYPLVRPDTIKQAVATPPAWRVKIGHTHVWSVHSISEISGAVAQLGEDLTAAIAAAEAAQDAAEAAQATANLAADRLASMASDNVLDRVDKFAVIQEFERVTAEKPVLADRASSLGIVTELATFNSAYATLASYLAGLSPSYTDTTKDTPIVSTTFKARWSAYYVAAQNLTNASFNVAKTTANWTDVNNRPTNLTAFNPADGAALGAAVVTTTNFNGRIERDPSIVRAPTNVKITKTINPDGSADVTISWDWDGSPQSISGFKSVVHAGTAGRGRGILSNFDWTKDYGPTGGIK